MRPGPAEQRQQRRKQRQHGRSRPEFRLRRHRQPHKGDQGQDHKKLQHRSEQQSPEPGRLSQSNLRRRRTTSDGSHGYVYSARNRLIETTLPGNIPLASYAYNAWGERIAKQGNTTTQFVYDEAGHLLGEYDATGNLVEETLWLDDTPVAVLRANSGPTSISTSLGGLPAGGDAAVYWIEPAGGTTRM